MGDQEPGGKAVAVVQVRGAEAGGREEEKTGDLFRRPGGVCVCGAE